MAWTPNTGRAVPHALQQACFKRDRWRCRACGFQARPNRGELNADHIVNRKAGGADTLDNLQSLCCPCHDLKTKAERVVGIARRKQRMTRRRPHPADRLTT